MKRQCAEDRYGTLGASVGANVGSFLGNAVQRTALSFFGLGDYELKSNSLVSGGGGNVPSDVVIIPKGSHQTRIMYREYLGDVYSSSTAGAFSLASYSINPGLLSTFPWLAPIAQQFDQWIPNGIVFEFQSQTSEYSSTMQTGTVIMATEYDVLDPVFSNKAEMMNCAYSNEAKSTERIIHGVECDPRETPNRIFWTRSGAVTTGADLRDYDLGTFCIATQGCPNASMNLGSLFVYYDITFQKEQIFNGIPLKGELVYRSARTGVTNSLPLGTGDGANWPTGNLTLTLTGTTITFPRNLIGAKWLVFLVWSGTTNTAVSPPTISAANGTFEGSINAPSVWGTGTTDGCSMQCFFRSTSQDAMVVTLTGMTAPAGSQAVWVQVYQTNAAGGI